VRVVVTGGAGFIGSHLCEALLDRGDAVVALDNFVTGRRTNVEHLVLRRGFQLVDGDVNRPFDIDGPVDAVMHLASPASPKAYLDLPIETLRAGSLGTFHCLDLATAKSARFLLASTSEVYGDPQVNPQDESYWGHVNPIGPRSVYDEAKRFAEAATMAYHRRHGLDTGIVRFFNTYGPRMQPDDGRVVSNFVMDALRGRPITIYGDGHQTRSFGYVSDSVRGLIALLDSGVSEPVNIGSPGEFTILELARIVLDLTGSRSELVHLPLPQDDPMQRRPDIRRAKEALGWEPSVPLREGLVSTIEWFRDSLRSAEPGLIGSA
jgi:nucleoside-diphosphate-sugar epimerase